MRRKNCNLEELCLFPHSTHNNSPMVPAKNIDDDDDDQISPMQNYSHQPLTIFYDGKISVTDVTELQAKSILMMANKNVQERVKTPSSGGSEPSTPTLLQSPHHQLYSPGPGLSMKRSLQRFLQKRKNRVQEASPYHHSN